MKAFYGHQEKIMEILENERKKPILLNNIMNEISEKSEYYNENDIFSEILDLRMILQYFVRNSVLQFKFENLRKIPGIFNPCIEETMKPFLFIK